MEIEKRGEERGCHAPKGGRKGDFDSIWALTCLLERRNPFPNEVRTAESVTTFVKYPSWTDHVTERNPHA